jgi:hypothetical protein
MVTKFYHKRDDFDFCIVNYPHLEGDVPHSTLYGVYIAESCIIASYVLSLLNLLFLNALSELCKGISHARCSTLLPFGAWRLRFLLLTASDELI